MTTLSITAEKKHSVRYDYNGPDFSMSVYVPKKHPALAPYSPGGYPATIEVEIKGGLA